MPLRFYVVIFSILIITGCASKDSTPPASSNTPVASSSATAASPSTSPAAPATAAVKAKVDVCALLTSDDLKSVQGEAYREAQRSDRQDGDYIVAQCYYALPTTVNSVVLNVTTAKEGSGATGPRTFWQSTFARGTGRERNKEKDKAKAGAEKREAEEEAPPPERVAGLGDDAYWIASRVGGALYVLKKDQFFRISVGGASNERTKLNKSKKLAQRVLKRI